jgi:hypothetical protein
MPPRRRLQHNASVRISAIDPFLLIVVGSVTALAAGWRLARAWPLVRRPDVTRDVEAAAPAAPPAPPAPDGRQMIAVIGIDHYIEWPRLHNAVADARGALQLFQRLGFEFARRRDGSEVTPLLDEAATCDAIQSLVSADLEQLDRADSLIVFFAGHGHTVVRKPDGCAVTTGYLVPVDGGPATDSPRRWLRLDLLLSEIARLPPRPIAVEPPSALVAPGARPATSDACASARLSIEQSNPFVAIDDAHAMQSYEISEQEWYALDACKPVAPGTRIAKAHITASDARAFCRALGGTLPSVEIWKRAYACATASADASARRCAIAHLADGVEEFTSDTDDSRPDNPLVYVIGDSNQYHRKDPSKPRWIPAGFTGSVTGARCIRRLP